MITEVPVQANLSVPLRSVFLDRDGVINEKMPEGQYVRAPADLRVLPGVPNAIARLNRVGVRVLVVSNQRGVALGLYTPSDVEMIHDCLQRELARYGAKVDAFFYCPHDKNACTCRKPLPGMFEQALERFPDLSPESSIMIGDSLSDIEFGKRLGIRTIWIEGSATTRKPGWHGAGKMADMRFQSLSEAVDALVHATEHEHAHEPPK